jgi:hypothetical protein
VTDEARNEIVERAVRTVLRDAARSATLAEADAFLVMMRSQLIDHLADLRRKREHPRVQETLARVLGRLYDETESGGTRA